MRLCTAFQGERLAHASAAATGSLNRLPAPNFGESQVMHAHGSHLRAGNSSALAYSRLLASALEAEIQGVVPCLGNRRAGMSSSVDARGSTRELDLLTKANH